MKTSRRKVTMLLGAVILATIAVALVGQPKFEGFDTSDAEYAVSKLDMDRREQATKKAEEYLALSVFSKKKLAEQLEIEGFSEEEATYAVYAVEVDWKELAVRKGKEYLDRMAVQGTGLIMRLEFDGFSHEEAVYAVKELGF